MRVSRYATVKSGNGVLKCVKNADQIIYVFLKGREEINIKDRF